MHQYLKAIGFGKIEKEKDVKSLLSTVGVEFDRQELVLLEEDIDFCVFERDFGEGIGISVCGMMDLSEEFEQEYYFPYFKGSGISSYADIIVERRMDQEAYLGICEDAKIGISIIFQLQNAAEYIRERESGNLPKKATSVTLSGLACTGTILLPVVKNPEAQQQQKEEARNRMMLISAAREGNQEAIESLTLDDIDTYSKVAKRLDTEDVFSIVETYFMPYGLECTLYSIMGEILDIRMVQNEITREMLYALTLDVNEMQFDVCVPKEELVGEPMVGRRFKGNIWLQGNINF